MRTTWMVLAALLTVSCRSAGPYGHSKVYSPLGDEEHAIEGNQQYDSLLAERSFDKVKGKSVWLFGVVTNRGSGPGGAAYIAVSLRTLQLRNLCDSDDEDTCRVTVSDREMGRVHVLVSLSADDDLGEHSVGIGSLVRVVGAVTSDIDPIDGTPIIRVNYYRHWPRGFYVTTKAAGALKR